MTEQEVRRYLRQMKDENSEQAFRGFYELTYDRLFRIAYYYVKHKDGAQEIVLDVFMRLWEQRKKLPEVNSIEDYCFILTKTPPSTIWRRNRDIPPNLPNTCRNRSNLQTLPKTHLSVMNFCPLCQSPRPAAGTLP